MNSGVRLTCEVFQGTDCQVQSWVNTFITRRQLSEELIHRVDYNAVYDTEQRQVIHTACIWYREPIDWSQEEEIIYMVKCSDDCDRSFTDYITTSHKKVCNHVESIFEDMISKRMDVYIEVWRVGSDEPLEDIYVGGPDKNNDTLSQDYLDFAKKHLTNH